MVEDIDDLIRLDPMEQVRFEKEQNLYSIIKTVEYLVSKEDLASNYSFMQEFAYTSGKVSGSEYDNQFRALLH